MLAGSYQPFCRTKTVFVRVTVDIYTKAYWCEGKRYMHPLCAGRAQRRRPFRVACVVRWKYYPLLVVLNY